MQNKDAWARRGFSGQLGKGHDELSDTEKHGETKEKEVYVWENQELCTTTWTGWNEIKGEVINLTQKQQIQVGSG